jgi:hypothetical protein
VRRCTLLPPSLPPSLSPSSHSIHRALFSKFVASPIFLSGIVVSEDPASLAQDGQEAAMHRAITNRLALSFPVTLTKTSSEAPSSALHPCLPQIFFSSLQYENGKCAMEAQQYTAPASHTTTLPQTDPASVISPTLSKRKRKALALLEQNPCSDLKSCSTNINWIRAVGSSASPRGGKGQCLDGTIEITLANTGRPQGTTKAAILSSKQSIESRLCRRSSLSLPLSIAADSTQSSRCIVLRIRVPDHWGR